MAAPRPTKGPTADMDNYGMDRLIKAAARNQPNMGNFSRMGPIGGYQQMGVGGQFNPAGSGGMQNQFGGSAPGLVDPNANVLGGMNIGRGNAFGGGSAMGGVLPPGMQFQNQPLAGNLFPGVPTPGLQSQGVAQQFNPAFSGGMQAGAPGMGGVGQLDPNANILGGANMGQMFPGMQQQGMGGQFNPSQMPGALQSLFGGSLGGLYGLNRGNRGY